MSKKLCADCCNNPICIEYHYVKSSCEFCSKNKHCDCAYSYDESCQVCRPIIIQTQAQKEVQQGYPEPEPKNGTAIEELAIHHIKSMEDYFKDSREIPIVGAIKADNGKAPITLIPAEYIEGTAQVFAFGGKKYGAHNFRKGLAHSRCLDAALRHILAIMRGEYLDIESGLPHVYHASCSLAMYDYSRINFPELNDLAEKDANELKKD